MHLSFRLVKHAWPRDIDERIAAWPSKQDMHAYRKHWLEFPAYWWQVRRPIRQLTDWKSILQSVVMIKSSNISRRRRSALSDGGAEYTAKREELVRIAARLFREKGYRATRLADIAAEAGIDRASVYYYVSSKEELFRESVEGILDANLAGAERIAVDAKLAIATRLRHIVELLIASYEDNFPQMYVYIQEQMHQVVHEESAWAQEITKKTKRFESVVMNLIEDGIANGEFRQDVPVRLASNALFGMFNWTHRWFTPGGKLGGKDLAEAFCAIFFDGMKNRATQPAGQKKAKAEAL